MSVASSRTSISKPKKTIEVDLELKDSVTAHDFAVTVPISVPSASSPVDSNAICNLSKRVTCVMRGVRILKVTQGRRNVSSLTLRVSRTALGNLMDIDEALLAQARKDSDEWFGAARGTNVDEFFRPSTATDRTSGIVAKLSLDVSRSSRAPTFSASEGENIDIVLLLVGIRFLRQHVDLLWRFVSSTVSDGPFAKEIRSLPVTDDDDDVSMHGPSPEERENMFTDLFGRIEAERIVADNRLRDFDALADALEDGRDASDARILETVSEKFEIMMAAALPYKPDTSYCS